MEEGDGETLRGTKARRSRLRAPLISFVFVHLSAALLSLCLVLSFCFSCVVIDSKRVCVCVRKVCGYGTTEASTCCSEGGTHMRFHEMIMMKDERGGRTRRKTVGGVLDVKALTCVYVCVCVCVCV